MHFLKTSSLRCAAILTVAVGLVACAVKAPAPPVAPAVPEKKAEVVPALSDAQQAFVEKLSAQGFARAEIESVLRQAEKRDDIIALMTKPAEGKPWRDYAPIFLNDARVNAGIQFWKNNAETLARAEQEYGVPARIIVSIIGVETQYGKIMGRFRVLDALNTLAFHYPPRSPFFTSELEQFFLLAREQAWAHGTPQGSYAGAMGMGQFMPSSYRKWAVDFDKDGRIDLFSNTVDVIGSVANYFKLNGWQTGGAVMMPVQDAPAEDAALLYPKRDLKPVAELQSAGVKTTTKVHADVPAVLVAYEERDARRHYLGFANFRAITRYNRSALYARAVHELSERLHAGVLGAAPAVTQAKKALSKPIEPRAN